MSDPIPEPNEDPNDGPIDDPIDDPGGIPPELPEPAAEPGATDEEQKLDFLIGLRKDEIDSLGDVFDQIDNKTGVALGFMFVAVGAVLSGKTNLSKITEHLSATARGFYYGFAGLAMLAVGSAIIAGIGARWPRTFNRTVDFDAIEPDDTVVELKHAALNQLHAHAVEINHVVDSKGKWATVTYLSVASCLIAYTILLAISLFFS